MAADEQTRQRVYARLRDVLGEEVATTLMSARPPFEWSEVATKTDLANLSSQLRGEMRELHGELRGEMGELRGEMGRVEGRLYQAMMTQTRYYVATTVGAVLTTGALAFAAAGLT